MAVHLFLSSRYDITGKRREEKFCGGGSIGMENFPIPQLNKGRDGRNVVKRKNAELREKLGDRAIMRALHFFAETRELQRKRQLFLQAT